MSLVQGISRVREEILGQPTHLLPLRLTVLVFLLRGVSKEAVFLAGDALLDVICLGMLLSPILLRSRALWLALFAVVAGAVARDWPLTDNHMYLLAYWCLACALSLWSPDPAAALARSAGALLALTFLLATLWKLALGEWLDGSFLHAQMLLEPRFAVFKKLIAGFGPEEFERNRQAIGSVMTYPEPDHAMVLHSTARLQWFALLGSWFFLALEALVGITYLYPRRWLRRLREPALILFLVSLYSLMPIDRFGFALTLLGFAACPAERKTLRWVFLLILPLLRLAPPVASLVREWAVGA